MRRLLTVTVALLLCLAAGSAQAQPTAAQAVTGYIAYSSPPCPTAAQTPCFIQFGSAGSGGESVTQGTVPWVDITAPTTYQGILNLSATTSTQLIAANVTMTFGALPDPGAFAKLTIIAPGSSCSFTVNWGGGTATATSGEQFGAGTNVGSDTKNLTGLANAPTLYSTAGCAPPNLIQFSN